MAYTFKICDPVHGFIRFDAPERSLIDSIPFQRLRYIRQMGVAYLVYPGATHCRFEHSLGVMELVTRIYNTLINPHHRIVPLDLSEEEIDYWRLILRFAALCHDLGHLPFSHTAEASLLPQGGHEQMTLKIIQTKELQEIWKRIGPRVEEDIIKLAVSNSGLALSPWEKVLSQVITEDNFGADRIDYLIRDANYTGVRYGQFDYHQLIDTLRLLPADGGLSLGVSASGIQSVESLWIARYMMYARVYQHPKSRVYTNHMHRFMARHYRKSLSSNIEGFLEQSDFTLLTALAQAANEGDYDARVLLKKERAFVEVPVEKLSSDAIQDLEEEFGDALFIDSLPHKIGGREFPVYTEEKEIRSSSEVSPFLCDIPRGGKPFCLYVHPDKQQKVYQIFNLGFYRNTR